MATSSTPPKTTTKIAMIAIELGVLCERSHFRQRMILLLCLFAAAFSAAEQQIVSLETQLAFARDGFVLLRGVLGDDAATLAELVAAAHRTAEREQMQRLWSARGCSDALSALAAGNVRFSFDDDANLGALTRLCMNNPNAAGQVEDDVDFQLSGLALHDERLFQFIVKRLPPRVAQSAAELLGVDNVRFYADAPFFKDPRPGGLSNAATPWHNDLAFSPTDSNEFVTLWCPLRAMSAANDALLEFARGSHRDMARLLEGDTWLQDEAIRARYEVVAAAEELAFGDCTAHHGNLWHRSNGTAHGNRLRPVFALTFVSARARKVALTHKPMLHQGFHSFKHWFSDVGVGEELDHPTLPIVWPLGCSE